MSIEFTFCGEVPENPVVVEAFPSKGYVSSIAAFYLIKEAGFKQIGSIRASELENFVVVHEGEIMRPIRIYAKDDIVLVFSEIIIFPSLISEFSREFTRWMGEINARKVITLASILGVEVEEGHKILGVATSGELKEEIRKLGIEELKEGILTGLSSNLSLHCGEESIPSISLLVQTQYVPDAIAASNLLEILSNLLNLDVNVEKLRETGKQFEERFEEMVNQMSKSQKDYKDMGGEGMYR